MMEHTESQTTAETLFHRFRHYAGGWSNFDLVEPCGRPGFCIGCTYHHPFCTEYGRVLKGEEAYQAFSTVRGTIP
jgi:hypothetical protein